MADYGAEPVWTSDGLRTQSLDDLPLADDTKAALRDWAAYYDARMHVGFDTGARERAAFDEEGLALWRRLTHELGSGWKVGYFNERLQQALWHDPEVAERDR